KPDCRHVIDINGQFESLEIKPVIGRIGKRGHEDRPDAASMEIVMDGDTNIADMTPPPLVLEDAGGTDDTPVKQGNDPGHPVRRVLHLFAPLLLAGEGEPQCSPSDLRKLHEQHNFLPIARLTGADRQSCEERWRDAVAARRISYRGENSARCPPLLRRTFGSGQ